MEACALSRTVRRRTPPWDPQRALGCEREGSRSRVGCAVVVCPAHAKASANRPKHAAGSALLLVEDDAGRAQGSCRGAFQVYARLSLHRQHLQSSGGRAPGLQVRLTQRKPRHRFPAAFRIPHDGPPWHLPQGDPRAHAEKPRPRGGARRSPRGHARGAIVFGPAAAGLADDRDHRRGEHQRGARGRAVRCSAGAVVGLGR